MKQLPLSEQANVQSFLRSNPDYSRFRTETENWTLDHFEYAYSRVAQDVGKHFRAAVLDLVKTFWEEKRRETMLVRPSGAVGNLPKAPDLSANNVPICFGMHIRLLHQSTSVLLKSLGKSFLHPNSSKQQMVVGAKEFDESTVWLVKAPEEKQVLLSVGNVANNEGDVVKRGDIVRLEHLLTKTNLHSHPGHPSPVTADQQEVTAFGSFGNGDDNDNWVVDPEVGEIWMSGAPIRLVHKRTGKNLHSHSSSNPIFTDGFQEITAYGARDPQDFWIAIVSPEKPPKTTAVPFYAGGTGTHESRGGQKIVTDVQPASTETTGDSAEDPTSDEPLQDFSEKGSRMPADLPAPGLQVQGIGDAPTYDDRLNFGPFVAAVREFIQHPDTRTPLTLSIEGRWGSGKSSFMRQLKRSLEGPLARSIIAGPKIKTVWFNPWRHEKNEEMWAAFALEFFDQVAHGLTKSQRLKYWWQFKQESFDLRSGWWDLLTATVQSALWLFAAFIGSYAVVKGLALKDALDALMGAAGAAGLLFIVPRCAKEISSFAGNPLKADLKRHFREQDYESKISFLQRFQAEFARFCKIYLKDKRAVVFIDDLDRCEVPRAADLIQGINLMISEEAPIIFVLGIDRAKIAAGLAVKHSELLPYLFANRNSGEITKSWLAERGIEYGYDFLEKFIQVPFRLPRANEDDLANLIGPHPDVIKKLGRSPVASAAPEEAGSMDPGALDSNTNLGGKSKGELPRTEVSAAGATAPLSSDTGLPGSKYFTQRDDVETLRPLVRHVADVLERNPRRVLQFVNCFRLQAYIGQQQQLLREGSGAPLSLGQLVQFTAICLRWPMIAADVEAEASDGRNLFKRVLGRAPADETERLFKTGTMTMKQHGDRWLQETELVEFLLKPLPHVGWSYDSRTLDQVDVRILIEISATIAVESPIRAPEAAV